ncbi:uncharacterized protein BJ212DRAFT_341274 [Suillus subaureus]|uniref:SH3 domain-containing protein n=1 Tax=Suillus subaureus TaxID=48587 RepID=A0A9P7JC60_9AGAM|nr:uncharacterized protein BJ212DRAFT_341274 [Suillus subaureus]KAG1814595.1 hypothetical protein BJ212DRAFT_341274 [Suillus subaureus]
MAAQELARWTRFAAKGGVGRCTATVDCVAREIGDLMFLKDDEITVLMQLPEIGYYLVRVLLCCSSLCLRLFLPHSLHVRHVFNASESFHTHLFYSVFWVDTPLTSVHHQGFCEGVVGRFSGTDVKFHGKLKRPIMAKRGSLGVADTRPMSLERASPSWPENSSGARAGSSNVNRPGSSLARADSASDSRSGGSPVRQKPLSPDMYLYSSSPERFREYERTRGRTQELTASGSGSSVYSTVSTSSTASTMFSDGDGWRRSEDSFLLNGVVPSSSSGSVQASSSTKSVPTSFSSSSIDSMPTSSLNSTPATSSAQSIPSLGSTHTSSAGSVEKLLWSLSNHSPSMSQSTSGSISTSASESMSGTFLNPSSTYGSLTSAPTSNSSSSSTNFATCCNERADRGSAAPQ